MPYFQLTWYLFANKSKSSSTVFIIKFPPRPTSWLYDCTAISIPRRFTWAPWRRPLLFPLPTSLDIPMSRHPEKPLNESRVWDMQFALWPKRKQFFPLRCKNRNSCNHANHLNNRGWLKMSTQYLIFIKGQNTLTILLTKIKVNKSWRDQLAEFPSTFLCKKT